MNPCHDGKAPKIFNSISSHLEFCNSVGDKITTFLAYTEDGSSFVYGRLIADGVFMFKVLSVIFFFSFMTSMFFYMGYMQWIISKIGWLLQWTIGTTPCESMNAAANIFLGKYKLRLLLIRQT